MSIHHPRAVEVLFSVSIDDHCGLTVRGGMMFTGHRARLHDSTAAVVCLWSERSGDGCLSKLYRSLARRGTSISANFRSGEGRWQLTV